MQVNKMKKKPPESRHAKADSWFGFALTIPAIVVLCVVIALPILKGIYVSFFNYKLADIRKDVFDFSSETVSELISGEKDISALSNLKWNNFKNYRKLFNSKNFLKSDFVTYFVNTIVFVFFTVVIQLVLGMLIALLLNTKIKGRGVFRGLLLIPWTIPSVVVAIVWRLMLHQDGGIINYLLNLAQFTGVSQISWLETVPRARASIIMASVWRQLPYMMVMLLAGLQSVDSSLEEAAKIDGANAWDAFLHVTIPSIRPVLITSTWIAIMNNFQMYTIIANLAGTGNSTGTMTLSIAAYQEAFKNYEFGRGAAIGVLWLVILFIITMISNFASERTARDYQ